MPGVDKEGSHSHKSRSGEQRRRKGSDDRGVEKTTKQGTHRKHGHKDTSVKRSESEPRKSSSSQHNSDENGDERSESLPRYKKHRDKERLDDGENRRYSGKTRGRQSEPIVNSKNEIDENIDPIRRSGRSRERRSEPISNNHSSEKESRSKHRKKREPEESSDTIRRGSRSRERRSEPISNNHSSEKESKSKHRANREPEESSDTIRRSSTSRERHSEPISKTEATNDNLKSKHHHKIDTDDEGGHRRSSRSRERRSESSSTDHRGGKKSRSKRHSRAEVDDVNNDRRSSRSRERRAEPHQDDSAEGEERKSKHRDRGEREGRKHRKRSERSSERRPESLFDTSVEIEAASNGMDNGETGIVEQEGRSRERHKKTKRHKSKNKDETINLIDEKNEKENGESHSRHNGESNHKRKEHSSKKKSENPNSNPTVVKTLALDGPSEVSIKGQEGAVLQRNHAAHINTTCDEYIWATPDGKHHMHVQTKEANVSKHGAEINDDEEGDGMSSDLLDLLKEEEMFWQKQQEMKESGMDPRKRRTSTINSNPADVKETKTSEKDVNRKMKKKRSSKTELELEEERLEREAKRLQRLRTHQEELLKKFQENLLRGELQNVADENRSHNAVHNQSRVHYPPDSREPSYVNLPTNREGIYNQRNAPPIYGSGNHSKMNASDKSHKNGPTTEPSNKTHNRTLISNHGYNSTSHERRFDLTYNHNDSDPHKHQSKPRGDLETNASNETKQRSSSLNRKSTPIERNNQNTSNPKYMGDRQTLKTQNNYHGDSSPPTTRAVCFSDDDEVFHESRRKSDRWKKKADYRGYFSDPDILRDNSIQRTYLARPMMRQRKSSLRCTACCRPINEERLMHVEGHNYYWHLKCFFCVVCQVFLNDKHAIRVRITNFNLHCRYCYSAKTGEQLSEV